MSLLMLLVLLAIPVQSTVRTNVQTPGGKSPTKPYNYKFTYGSCFRHQRHYKDSDIMDRIVAEKPDSFAWLGDFAYLDIIKVFPKITFHYQAIDVIKQKFEDSYNDPKYIPLRTSTKIYGIWDDHDSGINNSDKSNVMKEEIRQMYLDYIDEPKDSLRRTRNGMYESYYLDEAKNIKLILLDNRYERDSLHDESIVFDHKTLLGAEQEQWLKNEVLSSTAQFTIIAMGNQLLPDDRPIIETIFPKTRDMILSLHNPRTNILLISGDVHMAEIMEDKCSGLIHGYNIHEFTSSGLTHSVHSVLGDLSDYALDFLYPETYNTVHDRYMKENYAVIDFHIDPENPSNSYAEVNIKDHGGKTRLHKFLTNAWFVKKPVPDIEGFRQCIRNRGPAHHRMYSNMWKKAKNWKHPAFYILFSFAVIAFTVLRLAFKIFWWICSSLCKAACRKRSQREKEKYQ